MLEVTKAINLILFNFFCTINIYKSRMGCSRGRSCLNFVWGRGLCKPLIQSVEFFLNVLSSVVSSMKQNSCHLHCIEVEETVISRPKFQK